MATYNLNLNKHYCNHWGIWEAIREIIQNGLDQQTVNPDNKVSVVYNPKTKKLIISSRDSILERKTLLLGASSKIDDTTTIGQFGEGYKIALLVLTKMGIPVVIKNYARDERWTPSLKADSNYEGEEVLKVMVKKHVFKRLPDHNLSFEITGITSEQWSLIQSNYLAEHKDVKVFEARNGDQLLLDSKYKGLVFINGLFVEKLKGDYEFGYNLTPSSLTLDRDRQSVKNWQFNSVTCRLIEKYLEEVSDDTETNIENNVERIRKAVEEKKSEFRVETFNIPKNKRLGQAIIDNLKEEFGDHVYPVTSQKEADMISKVNDKIRPVFVDENKKSMIDTLHTYRSLENFQQSFGLEVNEKTDISPTEELELFLELNKKEMFHSAIEKFEKLIEQSKKWELKESPVEESITDEEEEIDLHGFATLKEFEADENAKDENAKKYLGMPVPAIDFDDDIPF